MAPSVDIPKRPFFKASEVCSIAGVEPYVLRSWEAEFPALGSVKQKEGSRVYRRADVELVLRIKDLLFTDGLTLGAARRKLEGERDLADPAVDASLDVLFREEARERLVQVKRGLREILDMLSSNGDRTVAAEDIAKVEAKEEDQPERPVAKAKRKTQGRRRTAQARTTSKRKRRTASAAPNACPGQARCAAG